MDARKITRDRDVRAALLNKVIAEHVSDPSTLVIEELGLEHGACRVDVTVVNGALHGYEIKSDVDTLERLPFQVEAYSRSLDKATLIVAERHLVKAEAILPAWWGIKSVHVGPRGAVHIRTHRPVSYNPSISPYHLAHLLWRPEAEELLISKGIPSKALRVNKSGLYSLLVETTSLIELRTYVRAKLKSRTDWRVHTPLS
ncbi:MULTISPECIES: sce7726 family protein [Pseudomonas]|uniref:sce7726 family protein n=1 Tax=Pseudomonas TaxID=286 RepID=UPI002362B026|nr:sce7726 family protein [Pseudomonas sp. SBT1-2]